MPVKNAGITQTEAITVELIIPQETKEERQKLDSKIPNAHIKLSNMQDTDFYDELEELFA